MKTNTKLIVFLFHILVGFFLFIFILWFIGTSNFFVLFFRLLSNMGHLNESLFLNLIPSSMWWNDGGSVYVLGLIALHNYIMYFLYFIITYILWLIYDNFVYFSYPLFNVTSVSITKSTLKRIFFSKYMSFVTFCFSFIFYFLRYIRNALIVSEMHNVLNSLIKDTSDYYSPSVVLYSVLMEIIAKGGSGAAVIKQLEIVSKEEESIIDSSKGKEFSTAGITIGSKIYKGLSPKFAFAPLVRVLFFWVFKLYTKDDMHTLLSEKNFSDRSVNLPATNAILKNELLKNSTAALHFALDLTFVFEFDNNGKRRDFFELWDFFKDFYSSYYINQKLFRYSSKVFLSFRISNKLNMFRDYFNYYFSGFYNPELEKEHDNKIGDDDNTLGSINFTPYTDLGPLPSVYDIKANAFNIQQQLFNFVDQKFFEIIWGITPSGIISHILMPSLILLYSNDDPLIDPDMALRAQGHQWYWEYGYQRWVDTPDSLLEDSDNNDSLLEDSSNNDSNSEGVKTLEDYQNDPRLDEVRSDFINLFNSEEKHFFFTKLMIKTRETIELSNDLLEACVSGSMTSLFKDSESSEFLDWIKDSKSPTDVKEARKLLDVKIEMLWDIVGWEVLRSIYNGTEINEALDDINKSHAYSLLDARHPEVTRSSDLDAFNKLDKLSDRNPDLWREYNLYKEADEMFHFLNDGGNLSEAYTTPEKARVLAFVIKAYKHPETVNLSESCYNDIYKHFTKYGHGLNLLWAYVRWIDSQDKFSSAAFLKWADEYYVSWRETHPDDVLEGWENEDSDSGSDSGSDSDSDEDLGSGSGSDSGGNDLGSSDLDEDSGSSSGKIYDTEWLGGRHRTSLSYSHDSNIIATSELKEGQKRLLSVDNPVVLPIHVPIRVMVNSADVLHSWAVPELGVKLDAVPGRINNSLLFITRPGVYFGQCSEICGVYHGFMPIVVIAIPYAEYLSTIFDKWLNES